MLERLFQKIFVAIVPTKEGHEVLSMAIKNKKILFKDRRQFEGEKPSSAMNRYIEEIIDPSPLYYIATLNTKPHQGAYSGCFEKGYKAQEAGVKSLCRDNKWTVYASRDELHALSYTYNVVGVDFIFSPFSVLENFFADKITTSFGLYALALPGSFSVAVFDNGQLEFAHHYTLVQMDLGDEESESISIEFTAPSLESDNGIDLEDIESLEELDIIDDLDSLGDIADLDELEEMSDFSEDVMTEEEKRAEHRKNSFFIKGDLDGSNEDYRRFDYLQKTLQQFYEMPSCGNRFIETVCIADSQGGSDELKRYLEEELFLNVLVRKIDLAEEIVTLAMIEEGLA